MTKRVASTSRPFLLAARRYRCETSMEEVYTFLSRIPGLAQSVRMNKAMPFVRLAAQLKRDEIILAQPADYDPQTASSEIPEHVQSFLGCATDMPDDFVSGTGRDAQMSAAAASAPKDQVDSPGRASMLPHLRPTANYPRGYQFSTRVIFVPSRALNELMNWRGRHGGILEDNWGSLLPRFYPGDPICVSRAKPRFGFVCAKSRVDSHAGAAAQRQLVLAEIHGSSFRRLNNQIRAVRRARDGHGRQFDGRRDGRDGCTAVLKFYSSIFNASPVQ
ncbi:hypothetical protein B0H19DRAFT_1077378 [Mycena capillaripes]|nr:hypothetical protein B0H19DRAFT_1077378 [Mycena capillaripes]